MSAHITHAMTIDVEDWFQVEAFAGFVARTSWDTREQRVVASMTRLLDVLAAANVKATCFTLGWVAEKYPSLVRRIVAQGHELASHGYWHQRVDRLDAQRFYEDIKDARDRLEQTSGTAVVGYRAPTFSIGPATPWASDALLRSGHRYSSSVYPVRHDLYGDPDAPRFPYRPLDGMWEIPMTTLRVKGHNLPCSGGGFFRLLPYAIYRAGLAAYARMEKRPGLFYLHPWEIDPGQPKLTGVPLRSTLRHRINLSRTEKRLAALLQDFRWGRIDEVFAELLGG